MRPHSGHRICSYTEWFDLRRSLDLLAVMVRGGTLIPSLCLFAFRLRDRSLSRSAMPSLSHCAWQMSVRIGRWGGRLRSLGGPSAGQAPEGSGPWKLKHGNGRW